MSTPQIIGIHGLDNKPEATVLSARWQAAILEGLVRNLGIHAPAVDFELVFYADLLHPQPLADEDQRYTDEKYPGDGPLPEYKDGWRDGIERRFKETGQDVVDLFGELFGRELFSDKVLESYVRDLNEYYFTESHKDAVRNRLMVALSQDPARPSILIAHSMGSIVALDVLRELEGDTSFRVPLFITIGSPLGLPYVVWKHKEEFGEARTPECVLRWLNFSEKRDRICYDTHLADDYIPNSLGAAVVDNLVINAVEKDPHLSYGYLRTPEVSKALGSFL